MDGLLLLNTTNGSLLLHSSFSSSFTPLAITDTLSQHTQNIKPIINLPNNLLINHSSHSSDSDSDSSGSRDIRNINTGAVSCNVVKHNLWLAGIASSDCEPSIIFEFLNNFAILLSKYLTTINPSSIENNYDLVIQLIHLTAPTLSNPFGSSSELNPIIHEFIPIKSHSLATFISEATVTLKGKSQYRIKPSIFNSNIPWRSTGLEYSKQEIWVDLIESISVILDPEGQILKYEVLGTIDIQSKLTGMPDITLKLSDPSKINKGVSFHRSIRHQKWESERVISFIPPDGKFRLMSYRSTPSTLPLPVKIQPKITIGEKGGSFEFKIACIPSIDKLVIRWELGKLSTGIISEQLNCRSIDGTLIFPHWEWNQSRNQISFFFNHDQLNCCLTGLWSHKSSENHPNHSIQVDYIGLKIDKLEIKHSHQLRNSSNHHLFAGVSSTAAVHKGVKMKFKNSKYEIRCFY
ncbi:hypothetical protein PSHT_14073 [Puccinia striiformis]|uniref:MHD domain-containing protein n=1 Tax=Puccinia striiformis TaxID=27350 RepID=A0A2S4UMI3_9BASI|nr:hypothetical protein PSHT_14073 [Puccinia striiformis]